LQGDRAEKRGREEEMGRWMRVMRRRDARSEVTLNPKKKRKGGRKASEVTLVEDRAKKQGRMSHGGGAPVSRYR
jgi:hypothetical protein